MKGEIDLIGEPTCQRNLQLLVRVEGQPVGGGEAGGNTQMLGHIVDHGRGVAQVAESTLVRFVAVDELVITGPECSGRPTRADADEPVGALVAGQGDLRVEEQPAELGGRESGHVGVESLACRLLAGLGRGLGQSLV